MKRQHCNSQQKKKISSNVHRTEVDFFEKLPIKRIVNVIGSEAVDVIVSLLLIHMKLVKQRFVCVCAGANSFVHNRNFLSNNTHFSTCCTLPLFARTKKLPYATLNVFRDKHHLPAAIGMAWFGRRGNILNH